MADPDKFSPEQLNYFRTCHVTAQVIPDGLRKVFKREWDARYQTSHDEWNDTAKNGADFYSLIPPKEQTSKVKELSIIRNGNRVEWDCTCLFYAILYSNCIGRNKLDPKVKKAVDNLRQYRNKYAHYHQSKVTDTDFQASIQDVINAFDDLKLDTNVVKKLKSQRRFNTDELQKIQEQLDKEKRRNQEPQTFCDLPPMPSHMVTPRSTEVDTIMNEMQYLKGLHPNEVTHVYLSGNPGCGKSETARQIGEKVFDENSASVSSYTFVATLNAASPDALLRSYTNFARLLRVNEDYIQSIVTLKADSPPEDKVMKLMALVNPKLALFSSWLMIVDNVVDLKKASRFFPLLGQRVTGRAQVLVTTQDSHSIPLASHKIHHQSLSEGMKPDDAVRSLCTISDQQIQGNEEVVLEIARALDFQPLALACTALYVKLVSKCGSSFTWYKCFTKITEGKREQTEKPFLDTSSQVYSQSMTTAVKMALDRVVKEDTIMRFAFQILSVLAQEPVPIRYVTRYVLLSMPEEDEELIEARIARSSLILISDDCQDVRVHQIVHGVLQTNVRPTVEGNCLSLANILTSFSDLATNDNEEPGKEYVMSTKSLIPHFVSLQGAIFPNLRLFMTLTKEQALLVAKCLSCCIGKLCYMNGQLKEAKSYLEMSIEIKEAFCIEGDHLVERNILGEILYELGDFKGSKLCLQQALGRRSCDFDDIKENVGLHLRALTNLGKTLSNDVRVKQEAERYLKEALAVLEKSTLDIPFAGRILNNIAMVYFNLCNYKEAKQFIERALSIDRTKYGDNHPFLSERYNDLAIVLQELGEHHAAEEYLRKAISVVSRYDENSPYLSTYYGNLGNVLNALRQHDEAKRYLIKAIAVVKDMHVDNHPTLAIQLNNLSLVFKNLRQYEEAKKCLERALAIDERVYDENHPTLAKHLNNLGSVLQKLRQYEEAKKLMDRSVAIDERVYDENHPILAIHLNNLGSVLRDLRQYEEAKKFLERALAIDERIYDENHPALAIDLNNLGSVLQDLRQYEEAKRLMERSVAIDERVYDENHPVLAIHLNNLGMVLRDLRQHKEAKKCIERAVAIDERVYDENHPILAQHLNDLGLAFIDLRQYWEANSCMERALAIAVHTYDVNHPVCQHILKNRQELCKTIYCNLIKLLIGVF